MSAWVDAIADARRDASFIYVGPADQWLDALRAGGVEVAVHVITAPSVYQSSPPLGPGWRAQQQEVGSISSFLDRHDPGRDKPILGLYSVDVGMSRGRTAWVADSELAYRLESKSSVGAPLYGVVPWMPAFPAPPRIEDGWFEQVTREHGVEALAVQHLGLSWCGEKTWRCRSATEVALVLERCPAVRISPWIDGLPINIAGAVSLDGEVLVLPPSRQLIVPDREGRPLYCGNVVGALGDAEVAAVAGHARAVGEALAGRGYVGMFGVDGIMDADGVRYHDLNPRVNGAMAAYDLLVPVVVGLLVFSGWADASRIASAELELETEARAAPSARWRLVQLVDRSGSVGPVPVAGLYRLDPAGPTLTFLEPDADHAPAAARHDVVLIRPRICPSTEVQIGHHAALADLWCSAELADDLIAVHGSQVVERLVQALLRVAHG